MNFRYALLALPVLLLASCNDSKQADDRTASGEVLAGTIDDEMLPLDTVTSQPPLMKSQPTPGATDTAGGEEGDDAASVDAAQPVIDSAVE
ncbi:MAG: hypothetical protein H6R45_695 [Proteobacteria bacterium]|nr:hypothetical protein [Pseudomonadota bacterium]